MVKIDESQVVRVDISIVDVLNRLEEEVGPISDEEIDYYSQYPINLNSFRNYVLENLYAKRFGGFQELRSMPDRSYTKLAIIAKRQLKKAGYQQPSSFYHIGSTGKSKQPNASEYKVHHKTSPVGNL